MSNEQELVTLPKPTTEPPTKKGMSRIRFFRILSSLPAQYDDILGAYGKAPQMPAIQIPRAATLIGDRVEITDVDIPEQEVVDFNHEPIQRGDGLRVLRRPREVVVVLPSQPEPNENPASQHDADLERSRFLQPLKKAA